MNPSWITSSLKSRIVLSTTLGTAIFGLLAATARSARPEARPIPLDPTRAEAAAILRQALDRSATNPADQRAELADAATQAAAKLGDDSRVGADLRAAVDELNNPDRNPDRARETLEAAHTMLTFQPLAEADLPQGFPPPGPLGEIRVKEYPAYRMAVSKAGGAAFWQLFSHITRQEIAMTAPVEMTYGDADAGEAKEQSMAFLYGRPDLGTAGADGNVEVVDADPVTVVSIGLNGSRTEAMVEQARDQLTAWLSEHPEYAVAGPLRLLGYNSPFVARDRQFWEVQIPIAAAKKNSPANQ